MQPLNISIFCSITVEAKNPLTGKPELTTIAKERHDLGEVKPGKRVKFRYKIIPAQAYMIIDFTKYSFVGDVMIDGQPMLFLNGSRHAADTEWLAIIDQLNKDGFQLTHDGSSYCSFEASDRFVALKAKKIWDLLCKHQKAHTKDTYLAGSFHRDNQVIISVSDGNITRPCIK